MIFIGEKHESQGDDFIMVYRQVVNADTLSGVIAIPRGLRNKRVEVTIREMPESAPAPKIDMANIENMMDGSITQSLIGIVSDSGKSLEEYRAERLLKYERVD
jgi:hypothetical protein